MLALALSSALGINRQLLWGNDDVTVAAKELPLCLQDCACVSDLSQQTYSHGYGSCQVQKAFAQSALRPDDVTGAYCADDCTGADSYWRSYLETLKGMDCTGVFQDGATAKVWTDSSSSSSLNQQVGAWFADNNDIWSNDNNSPWRKLWSTSATTSTSKTLRSSRGGIGHMKVAIHPRRLAESLARALTTICTLEPTKAPTTPPTLAPTTSPTKKSDFMHDCLATCPCPNQAASGATCIESKAFAIAALQTDCMGGCPVEVTNAIIAASSRKCDDDGSQVGVRTGKKASADSLWSQFRPRFRRLNSGAGNWASIFTQGAKEEEEDEEKYDVSITAVACTLAPTKAPTAAPSRSPTKAPTATPELAGCMTNSIGGGSNGRDQPCAFPFTYKGVTYDTCTDTDATNKNEGLWCSTKTDWFGQHVSGGGNYGNCVESPATGCDLPCRTNGDTSTPKPRTACVFPFIYQGRTYATCAPDEDHPAGWCSTLTDLFDSHIQGNWGYCNTEGCAGSADRPIPESATTKPTKSPTPNPSNTNAPTKTATKSPTKAPTKAPTLAPSAPPTEPPVAKFDAKWQNCNNGCTFATEVPTDTVKIVVTGSAYQYTQNYVSLSVDGGATWATIMQGENKKDFTSQYPFVMTRQVTSGVKVQLKSEIAHGAHYYVIEVYAENGAPPNTKAPTKTPTKAPVDPALSVPTKPPTNTPTKAEDCDDCFFAGKTIAQWRVMSAASTTSYINTLDTAAKVDLARLMQHPDFGTMFNFSERRTITDAAILPTSPPVKAPTKPSTPNPSKVPTKAPSKAPTKPPTTKAPTKTPTKAPTKAATSAPLAESLEQCTGTFVAPSIAQSEFPLQTPFKVNDNVYVFGSKADGGPAFKMASVDATGAVTGNRFRKDISDLSELTIELWDTATPVVWGYPATIKNLVCPGTCPLGTAKDDSNNGECQVCAAGKAGSFSGYKAQCVSCAAGRVRDQNSGTCKDCEAGQYSGWAGCTACEAGSYSTAGRETCTACALGKYQPEKGKSSCQGCNAGFHASSTGHAGQMAPIYTGAPASMQCTPCAAGSDSTAGQATCTDCLVDYYWGEVSRGGERCRRCDASWTNYGTITCGQSGVTSVDGCQYPADYCYQRNGKWYKYYTCTPAAVGSCIDDAKPDLDPNKSGKQIEVTCWEYEYTSLCGPTPPPTPPTRAPTPATGPTVAPTTYPTPVPTKFVCPIGKFLYAGECLDCAPGRSGSAWPATGCTACAPGKFQPVKGQASCKDCTAGRYADSTESMECLICGSGSESENGKATCTNCPADYYWNYEFTEGQRCRRCDANVVETHGITTCGATGVAGYSGCKFPAGYCYQRNGKWYKQYTCTPAAVGPCIDDAKPDLDPSKSGKQIEVTCWDYEQDTCAVTSAPTPAPTPVPGSPTIAPTRPPTPAPTTLSPTPAPVLCVPNGSGQCICPLGTFQYADECLDCAPGRAGSSPGVCTACAPGRFQDDKGQQTCTACTSGRYTSTSGNMVCSNCGAGKSSAAGKAACANCPADYYWNYGFPNGQRCRRCDANVVETHGITTCGATGVTSKTGCKFPAGYCYQRNGKWYKQYTCTPAAVGSCIDDASPDLDPSKSGKQIEVTCWDYEYQGNCPA